MACRFVWHELGTKNSKAALDFYGKVIGWKSQEMEGQNAGYTLLLAGDARVGGVFTLTPEMTAAGARPGWMGYIGVPDVAQYSEKITAKGGKIVRPMTPIPNIGSFAIATDPHGAMFTIFTGPADQAAPDSNPAAVGHIGWNELHAGDGVAAFAFYSDVFGFSKGETMDMGPMGVYQLFGADGVSFGGMMTKMPQSPAPFWLYYWNVDGIDSAIERATAGGAQIIHGPSEVPGGSWIANAIDPEGVIFAMVSAKR